jgi:phosphate transport system protein
VSMLRELLSIFRSGEPLSDMGDSFSTMLRLTFESTLEAGKVYFQMEAEPEARTRIYKQDVKVNKLERSIRKQVIAHLSLAGNSASLPYCLLLMSLVKDVERIGDYAKNLAEVPDYHPGPLPDDELVEELREIRKGVEAAFEASAEVFEASDHERAVALIREGRDLAHRCDTLVERVAHSGYDAGATTAVILGTRYYKRIGAHVLNVLSSVVMPLHKLDYYDEDELLAEGDKD